MIVITTRTGAMTGFPLCRHDIRIALHNMLSCLGLSGAHVEIILTDDGESAQLNREFLGCYGPTNILSFPAAGPVAAPRQEPDSPPACRKDSSHAEDDTDLGVLALSTGAVHRESFLYGQPPHRHALRLLAHGLLHLAGYDHGPQMDDMTETLMQCATGKAAADTVVTGF
jgi:probable rRNA maturation factor